MSIANVNQCPKTFQKHNITMKYIKDSEKI